MLSLQVQLGPVGPVVHGAEVEDGWQERVHCLVAGVAMGVGGMGVRV